MPVGTFRLLFRSDYLPNSFLKRFIIAMNGAVITLSSFLPKLSFFSTVTLHSAVTPSADSAVIIASPSAIAVTVPFSSTVAIDGSDELHVTVRLNASSGFTVAVIVFLKAPKLHYIGKIMAGFGILFIGMDMMGTAMEPLEKSEAFISMMTTFSNPILGILGGTLFTALVQSSSAAVGILQAPLPTATPS